MVGQKPRVLHHPIYEIYDTHSKIAFCSKPEAKLTSKGLMHNSLQERLPSSLGRALNNLSIGEERQSKSYSSWDAVVDR